MRGRARDLAERLSRGGTRIGAVGALDRGDPMAADEVLIARLQRDRAIGRSWCGIDGGLVSNGHGAAPSGVRRVIKQPIRRRPRRHPQQSRRPALENYGAVGAPDDEHLEPARAVHALDAAELDVRGRGGAGDERERAPLAGGRREALESLGHGADDLIDLHHAEMEIRHERERAAALAGAAVEHDRARLGDRRGAAGEHAVDGVERLVRQTVVGHELDGRRAPGLRQVGRNHEPARPVAPARLPQRRRERVRLHHAHDGLVVGHTLGQQVAQAIGVEPERAFVAALDGHVVGQLVGRDVGQRGPDPPEDVRPMPDQLAPAYSSSAIRVATRR